MRDYNSGEKLEIQHSRKENTSSDGIQGVRTGSREPVLGMSG